METPELQQDLQHKRQQELPRAGMTLVPLAPNGAALASFAVKQELDGRDRQHLALGSRHTRGRVGLCALRRSRGVHLFPRCAALHRGCGVQLPPMVGHVVNMAGMASRASQASRASVAGKASMASNASKASVASMAGRARMASRHGME